MSDRAVLADLNRTRTIRLRPEAMGKLGAAADAPLAVLGESADRVAYLVVAVPAPGDTKESARVEELIRRLTPDVPLPSPAGLLLARGNAQARAEFLGEFPLLAAAEIGRARSSARNPYALAGRWRQEGRIFGVTHRGRTLYPLFQLDEDGEPLPVVRAVLAALPRTRMSEWEQALWWAAGNGQLGGRRPVDLLDSEPEQLVAAAQGLRQPTPL